MNISDDKITPETDARRDYLLLVLVALMSIAMTLAVADFLLVYMEMDPIFNDISLKTEL